MVAQLNQNKTTFLFVTYQAVLFSPVNGRQETYLLLFLLAVAWEMERNDIICNFYRLKIETKKIFCDFNSSQQK